MIALKPLLAHLTRGGVTEVVLQSGRPAGARVDGALEEIDDEPMSGDDILSLLFSAGGSRYVDSLGPKPTQWRTRVEGVGAITVSATARGEMVQAHFTLRDAVPAMPPQRGRAPSIPPGKSKSVRPPRGDGVPSSRRGSTGAPASKRKGAHAAKAHHDHGEPARTPAERHAPTEPRLDMRARRDDFEVHTPAPLGFRGEMPTLPSEAEVQLDIAASDIPSVPVPARIDEAFGPLSPRTLPEAAHARPPAPARPEEQPVVVVGTVRRDGTRGTPQPAPAAALPPPLPAQAPIGELTEPFAMSARSADLTGARYLGESTPPPQPVAVGPGRTASGRTTRPFARDPHTPEMRRLLRLAREAGASDLHLVAGRPPLVRVAGQVVARGEPLDPALVEDMMLSRVPARLAAVLDRDGSCDFALEEGDLGRFRVNVSRQRTGIKASMRLVAPEIPTLASLGLPDAIAAATRHHQGLIVITGPTGHGKTTTLAAIVDILNRETTRHIITVEDPIEYLHPRKKAMMSQREVGTHTRSFQTALKASLREDPDVIVVGELRDTETVRMALSASETGHLVIGTMSTPSAARTIDRLIDLFPPADQQQVRMTLAGGLLLIVGQRLLPDTEGRRMVAAAEVLPGMVPLWNLIRDSRTYQIPSLQQRGKGLGVIRLDDSLAELVRAGRTTAAAAIAVAEAPDELEAALGIRRPSQTMPRPTQTSPVRPPDPKPSEPGAAPKGGFLERAGALFGGKKGT
jgi:twitching motility protein PilT